MAWYPLFVQMTGRRCWLWGGGAVARRKAESLLEAGAGVVAVSPEFFQGVRRSRLAPPGMPAPRAPGLRHAGPRFVRTRRGCHRQRRGQRAGGGRRETRRVWVNVFDTPDLCTVQAAAVVRRGPLQVAIHTRRVPRAVVRVARGTRALLRSVVRDSTSARWRALASGFREQPLNGTIRRCHPA